VGKNCFILIDKERLGFFRQQNLSGFLCIVCLVLNRQQQTKLVKGVCQWQISALAEVDWQEGAAGICGGSLITAVQVQTARSTQEKEVIMGKSLHD